MALSDVLAALLAPHGRAGAPTPWRWLICLVTLPLFVGAFSYTTDILPAYVATKAWPFLMLPLAAFGYATLRLPARATYAVTLCYIVSVPPVMAMAYLGSSFTEAILISIKLLPLGFYFALPEAVALLRIDAPTLRSAVVRLGQFTFALMLVLWVVVPASAYRSEFGIDTVFIGGDPTRGDRIQMPMCFGLLFIFKLGHDLARGRRLLDAALLVLCFVLLLTIYKERIPIVFSLLIVLLAFFTRLLRSRLMALATLAVLGAAAATLVLLLLGGDRVAQALGDSLNVRIDTTVRAWDFIRDDPLRWLFGVGSTTKYAAVTINTLFRDPAFFLADIGWLGVVFEAGLLGALPILALHLASLAIAQSCATPEDSVSMALADYALYVLAASVVYSPTLLPGEIATVTALAVIFRRFRK